MIHRVSGSGSLLMPPVIATSIQSDILFESSVNAFDVVLVMREAPVLCTSRIETISPTKWSKSAFTLRIDARHEAKNMDWSVTHPKRGTGTHSARSTKVSRANNIPNKSINVSQLALGRRKFVPITKPVRIVARALVNSLVAIIMPYLIPRSMLIVCRGFDDQGEYKDLREVSRSLSGLMYTVERISWGNDAATVSPSGSIPT